jgi:hypothetical protein
MCKIGTNDSNRNLTVMKYIIEKDGEYLTNYGMQKFHFTDNKEFAYVFTDIETARRFADHYHGKVTGI